MLDRSSQDPHDADASHSATELFAEFVAAREKGDAPDVQTLYARAGPEAAELRARIRALSVLEDLGDVIREDLDPEVPPGSNDPRGGRRIGRYELGRLLGQGGLSRVYAAHDPQLGRHVALKVIANEHITAAAAQDWLKREGRSLARLKHSNIVDVFEIGESAGGTETYIAMELVDAPSLVDVLEELRARRKNPGGATTDARVRAAADHLAGIGARVTLALGIARALDSCHAAGVLHRDVKPGNVLVQADGEPKLIDFGLAHLGEEESSSHGVTQRLVATPAYMAPEQLETGRTGTDPRSDQFSFGVLLYELLTLVGPFQRSTRTQTLDAVTAARPQAPRHVDAAIPVDLETICVHALEALPAERYVSMHALVNDLEAFLDHRAILVAPPSLTRKLRLWSRRNRRDLFMGGVPLVAVAVVASVWTIQRANQEDEEVRSALASFSAKIPDLATPAAFEAAFPVAAAWAERSSEHDARWTARWLGSPVEPDARAAADRLSHRLAEVLEPIWLANARFPFEYRAAQDAETYSAWQRALLEEERTTPNSPWNQRDRERGTVRIGTLPQGSTVRILERVGTPTPVDSDWAPFDASSGFLRPGNYRVGLVAGAEELVAEVDLEVRGFAPGRTLTLHGPSDAWRERMVRIAATESGHFGRAAAFRVLPVWISWTEARALLEAIPEPDRPRMMSSLVAPKLTDPGTHPSLVLTDVLVLAEAIGLRLPTLSEAYALIQASDADPASVPPLPPGFSGEYLTGSTLQGERTSVLHPTATAKTTPVLLRESALRHPEPLAFRFVRSEHLAP